ncbi:hypothetical protein CR51_14815 [Caballeronia megalochromosomata]|nr:hypothetical protein CR51_14815 [Caballeronia megalochromosomata]
MQEDQDHISIVSAPKTVRAALIMLSLLWLLGLLGFLIAFWAIVADNGSVSIHRRIVAFVLLGLSSLAFGFRLIAAVSRGDKYSRYVVLALLALWTFLIIASYPLRFDERVSVFPGFYFYFSAATALLFMKRSAAWFR